jgi:hypothetical protein
MIINIGQAMIWKEMVMAYFKVLCQHLSEETEKKHENP